MLWAEALARFAPAALVIAALLWGVSRILYLKRAGGVAVLSVLSRKRSPLETGLAVSGIVIDTYLVARAFLPILDKWLPGLDVTAPLVGLTSMTVGLLLMAVSQAYMGRAWRIGVPDALEAGQRIISAGPFAYSRNPIYIGIFLFLLGALLIAPNLLSVSCFAVCLVLVPRLVADEEAFMRASFGADYEDYCRRVRRWL